jgi:hypothetical protein
LGRYNLVNAAMVLQIKAGNFASDNGSFNATFEHS